MTNEELENKIKEFVEISEKLPERYRDRCFEVLLTNFLSDVKTPEEIVRKIEPVPPEPPKKLVIPIDVRAFLQQYNISEDIISKLFITDGNEIRPVYIIKTVKKSEAQIQVALLTALENALKQGGRFEFSQEVIRGRCKDRAVYDEPNFKAHFKNNKKLFKDLTDEDSIELSPEGKTELAEVISAIV